MLFFPIPNTFSNSNHSFGTYLLKKKTVKGSINFIYCFLRKKQKCSILQSLVLRNHKPQTHVVYVYKSVRTFIQLYKYRFCSNIYYVPVVCPMLAITIIIIINYCGRNRPARVCTTRNAADSVRSAGLIKCIT